MRADDFIEDALGNVYELKKKLDAPYKERRQRRLEIAQQQRLMMKEMQTTTTEKNNIVTPYTPRSSMNVSIDELKLKLKKIEIRNILSDERKPFLEFTSGKDDPDITTRRFDQLKEETPRQINVLRTIYHKNENVSQIKLEKTRVMGLMAHFIYAIRYKLPYMQLVRKKYMSHVKYRIGFCIALLRDLRYQQKILYSTMHAYWKHFPNVMINLKLYEKIVRLDIDIRDVVKYVRKLDYDRKALDDPMYYMDSQEQMSLNDVPPSMQGMLQTDRPRVGGGDLGTRRPMPTEPSNVVTTQRRDK